MFSVLPHHDLHVHVHCVFKVSQCMSVIFYWEKQKKKDMKTWCWHFAHMIPRPNCSCLFCLLLITIINFDSLVITLAAPCPAQAELQLGMIYESMIVIISKHAAIGCKHTWLHYFLFTCIWLPFHQIENFSPFPQTCDQFLCIKWLPEGAEDRSNDKRRSLYDDWKLLSAFPWSGGLISYMYVWTAALRSGCVLVTFAQAEPESSIRKTHNDNLSSASLEGNACFCI